VSGNDPDPRGLPVIGADGAVAGTVRDMWVDRAEVVFRYLEVEVPVAGAARRVLLPMNFARVDSQRVKVRAILAAQFAQVPGTRNPDAVTLLEEDKIMGYYGGGTLYATAARQEPLL
ncbi:MAG: PRC-barrel domain-containing protein, partial [Rhizobiales bacterium]|nr:PRC-barrel domain-containing protein [Rhizobacter sp.]